MKNTRHGEIEQHYQKTCVLSVFFFSLCHLLFLCTKTSKCIQISVYGITGHYQKRVIWMFFEYIRHQNAKSNGNLSIWENKTT